MLKLNTVLPILPRGHKLVEDPERCPGSEGEPGRGSGTLGARCIACVGGGARSRARPEVVHGRLRPSGFSAPLIDGARSPLAGHQPRKVLGSDRGLNDLPQPLPLVRRGPFFISSEGNATLNLSIIFVRSTSSVHLSYQSSLRLPNSCREKVLVVHVGRRVYVPLSPH